ncbi:metalloregulator ArsR/SmtB family transcription factor [Microvirga tunisiensis]|uniref:Metalloregulator ArsR/SmtB family transcription factor n=2 Tax=Pannonibacter tanglangensis TaxID=2750084 RepID=A0A7X5F4H2_9HYPH|nr:MULTISPECIES: metalloregulator ArsR/SmtB family transcription factor [unclassified Pannonibacter]NBN62654.1 metalloregulator ArsR/SmtB family transcription factor [Pannonibacter sp. XCT-34]NBN78309.1 metalloregulator ArsR/SmtB family transcription factor [Pannonibacter sp. XCT-53]
MKPDLLEAKAEMAAQFLKMIASAPRLLLLCQMAERECSVGELAEKTGMRMPTVSQQLSLLRAQGLVVTRREGTTIYYRLASEAAREVMGVLFKHFCAEDAAGLALVAEAEAETSEPATA